ncbi:hypothetical protein JI739_19630 [Ramlibacter sp. AW1]|uniref:Uncharacterized protein n=1 Tax=Ramlibacter aurantiacus TaxID=2801330 RepID=A0A936ZRZ0_9BURK|nr:hypothetical protein [Ramlibacter aurantiacus]MBL0422566.1 hypothetical protein [Ramlibacter aurantiacus]
MTDPDQNPEVTTGFVLDIACIRKYPKSDLVQRGREHSVACALMGHCVESGYALVQPDGSITLLDSAATPLVVKALVNAPHGSGVLLEVSRERDGEDMKTVSVTVVGGPQ